LYPSATDFSFETAISSSTAMSQSSLAVSVISG
jgi:hypothetical protein